MREAEPDDEAGESRDGDDGAAQEQRAAVPGGEQRAGDNRSEDLTDRVPGGEERDGTGAWRCAPRASASELMPTNVPPKSAAEASALPGSTPVRATPTACTPSATVSRVGRLQRRQRLLRRGCN
jgi:hypothetical protein